jgi:hypothetical protein
MTTQAVVDAVTVPAWGAVVYKLPSLRRRHDPARRLFWFTLLAIALTLSILLPPAYLGLDRLTGVANLARLVGDGLGMLAAWAAQACLFHLSYPPRSARVRTRILGLALVGTLLFMASCLALAPIHEEALDFAGRYGQLPSILAYRLAFLGFLALGMGNAARLYWRYATVVTGPALRLGLRLSAIAAALGLAFVANEVLRVGVAPFGRPDPIPAAGSVSQALIAACIAVGIVGATVPRWGPHVGIPSLVEWIGHYRSLRRLYPLWLALYHAKPEIALQPPPGRLADMLRVWDVDWRLYRRVVETRDGRLLVRPLMDRRAAAMAREFALAAGLAETEVRAVIEATELATALRRPHPAAAVPDKPSPAEISGGTDLPSEVVALERVARYYQRSPIVQRVLRQLQGEPSCPISTGKGAK